METVRQYRVDKGSVALWWLGQMGYLVKTSEGTVLSVDAYLTNSCQKIGETLGLNFNRRVPVFIEPEELDVDHFLCTHSHYDHADPETIGRLRKQAVQTFVGPGLACESFCNCGVGKTKIQQLYPGAKLQVSDVVVLDRRHLATNPTCVLEAASREEVGPALAGHPGEHRRDARRRAQDPRRRVDIRVISPGCCS